jgi:hypothetical protein
MHSLSISLVELRQSTDCTAYSFLTVRSEQHLSRNSNRSAARLTKLRKWSKTHSKTHKELAAVRELCDIDEMKRRTLLLIGGLILAGERHLIWPAKI